MPYVGGKEQEGVWQRIVNLMPDHGLYVEPFLGSGAVMRLKQPAAASIGMDLQLHAPTVAFFRGRSDVSLRERCGIDYVERLPVTMAACIHWPRRTLVYCDPPYVLSTKSGPCYEHEMTDLEHLRLLHALFALPCMVILSGYTSHLYESQGLAPLEFWPMREGWHVESFEVTTRGHTRKREFLWFNFPRPAVPADVSNVGANHRQRWRIEKRRRRMRARFAAMNPAERATLFAALVDVMPVA